MAIRYVATEELLGDAVKLMSALPPATSAVPPGTDVLETCDRLPELTQSGPSVVSLDCQIKDELFSIRQTGVAEVAQNAI